MNTNFSFLNILQVAAPAGGTGQFLTTIVMFGLIFLIFYFLIIRPQNKRQKETKQMLEQLKKGDKIQTIGGIRGTIVSVKEETVIVKVDTNSDMEFVRSAIANVIKPEAKPSEKAEKKTSAKKLEEKQATEAESGENEEPPASKPKSTRSRAKKTAQ